MGRAAIDLHLSISGDDVTPQSGVYYPRPKGMAVGQIIDDYHTVWHEHKLDGTAVTLRELSRPTRNEIINGAVLYSSYNHNGKSAPATARFIGGTSVNMTDAVMARLKAGCIATLSPSYGEAQIEMDINSMLRDNAFWTNKNPKASQPMSMGAGIVHVLDIVGDRKLIEAIHPNDFPEFIDYWKYPYLCCVPGSSRRDAILNADKKIIGMREWFHEPMRYFAEYATRIPYWGYVRFTNCMTGWAAWVDSYRVKMLGDTRVGYPWVLVDGRTPHYPFAGY